MIKPLTRILGRAKPIKIRALTRIIPAREVKKELKNFISMFIPIIPPWMLEFEDERQYLVPKSLFNVLVEDRDIDDWNYLLERFNNLLANLTKVLNNIRKIDYQKIVTSKLLEREITNRRIKLTEKLLEKEGEKDKKKKTDPKTKIDDLTDIVLAAGAALVGGVHPQVNPLDAATIADAKASGADLVAAAFLATLEASNEQHVADALQVMLNRAKTGHSLAEEITAQEQFSPFSAAIYGYSADKAAERKYGHLNVTKKEIFDLAKQSNGLEALAQRFNAGNPAVAQKVLDDFKSQGPLSKSSANFVGGAKYFMAYPVGAPNERQRPDGGNYFRDTYSSGAILLPELLDYHYIQYNTNDPTSDISKFIVDKPTIIDTQKVGEPLVIIPVDRPIGRSILSLLFKEPFRKIDQMFITRSKKSEKEVKAQTPIKNNTTSINRTTIPQSPKVEQKEQPSMEKFAPELFDILYPPDGMSGGMLNFGAPEMETPDLETNFSGLTLPPLSSSAKKSNIDTVSQKTDSIFGPKVIFITQDIYATEE